MDLPELFTAAMSRLGPFGPRLAVAVSGGADSTALALLAQGWAARHRADMLALIVDHGLRDASAAEAGLTAARLAARGIPSKILTLAGLAGPGLQQRARLARHAALAEAARAEGCLNLLLGHHAADQSETVAMRAARGPGGEAGIAGWSARHAVVLLRPLLGIQPAALRAYLAEQGMAWVEDPSNQDPRFERIRIRQSGATAKASPAARQAAEVEIADFLARHCELRPEGFALIRADQMPPAVLGVLIRVLGGAAHPPRQAALVAGLRPATLGGVRITPAGRLGPGWLLAREPAACAPAIPAIQGGRWDNRFTLQQSAPPGASLGALGAAAGKFKHYNGLPALILRTMPCLTTPQGGLDFPVRFTFTPPAPATSHPFLA